MAAMERDKDEKRSPSGDKKNDVTRERSSLELTLKSLSVREELITRLPVDDERSKRVDEGVVREGDGFLGDLPSGESVVEGVDLGESLLVVDEQTEADCRVCEGGSRGVLISFRRRRE